MSYFKPLRRKFGIVMLVMACAFTAGWVRSKVVQDEVRIAIGYLPLFFNSCNGELTWWQLQHMDAVPIYSFAFEWRTDSEIRGHVLSFSTFVTPKAGRKPGLIGVRIPRAEMLEMPTLVTRTVRHQNE